MTYRYITLFDDEGFEGIIDITCDDHRKIEAAIMNEPNPEKEKEIDYEP